MRLHGLRATLDTLDDVDEIILVAHSMGGIVSRYLLESGAFSDRTWFDRITTLVTIGTPHSGAPAALTQILGREEILGVSGADVRRLANDPRYLSAYELVPPAGSALLLTAPHRGAIQGGVDPFDEAVVKSLGLRKNSIEKAKVLWEGLSLDARPEKVAYFFFVGSAHTTHIRNEWGPRGLDRIDRKDSGDGTVPIASALAPGIPHGFAMKKHMKIFGDRELRRALYDILGAPDGMQPFDASTATPVGAPNVFGLSIDRDTYRPSDPIEIVVSYNRPIDDPQEAFSIVAIDPGSGSQLAEPRPVDFNAAFHRTQMQSFSLVVNPNLPAGMYELVARRAVDDPDRTFFFVSDRGAPDTKEKS
ncbi:MAG: GPI inositol-deacylase [Acidimicrobiia bacterium]|nr:GPI inositol-deacylase [Acidimicrobiia bacterium]